MSEIDSFANKLLDEAKRFLEKADDSADLDAQSAYRHAALMLSFCALEAHVNALSQEFDAAAGLSAHEHGILLEREVRLEDGEFRLKKTLRITRLEDRIDFLHVRFSGAALDPSAKWRQQLGTAVDLRNKLTHAKEVLPIGQGDVKNAIQAVVDALDSLYRALYKRPFPLATLGIQSQLDF